jgi:hypothetical protein
VGTGKDVRVASVLVSPVKEEEEGPKEGVDDREVVGVVGMEVCDASVPVEEAEDRLVKLGGVGLVEIKEG